MTLLSLDEWVSNLGTHSQSMLLQRRAQNLSSRGLLLKTRKEGATWTLYEKSFTVLILIPSLSHTKWTFFPVGLEQGPHSSPIQMAKSWIRLKGFPLETSCLHYWSCIVGLHRIHFHLLCSQPLYKTFRKIHQKREIQTQPKNWIRCCLDPFHSDTETGLLQGTLYRFPLKVILETAADAECYSSAIIMNKAEHA